METEAVFENIYVRIHKEISKAEKSIYISGSWCINQDIFDQFILKVNEGCAVHLIVSDDEINNNSNLDFDRLQKCGVNACKLSIENTDLTHQQFCVVDYKTVITSSYNWADVEVKKFKNIIVINDMHLAEQFVVLFMKIKDENIFINSVFSNNKKLVKEIFEKNPDLFIDLILYYYPLNQECVEKYEAKWDWKRLSKDSSLDWSIDFIEKYESKWDWTCLIDNAGLPWSFELIEKYEGKFSNMEWRILSQNKSLPWSLEVIEKF